MSAAKPTPRSYAKQWCITAYLFDEMLEVRELGKRSLQPRRCRCTHEGRSRDHLRGSALMPSLVALPAHKAPCPQGSCATAALTRRAPPSPAKKRARTPASQRGALESQFVRIPYRHMPASLRGPEGSESPTEMPPATKGERWKPDLEASSAGPGSVALPTNRIATARSSSRA